MYVCVYGAFIDLETTEPIGTRKSRTHIPRDSGSVQTVHIVSFFDHL